MKRRVLNGGQKRGHQRSCDWQLTQKKWHNNISDSEIKLILQNTLNYFVFSVFWLISILCSFVFIWSILLVNSIVDVKMVSTRKKKPQNTRFFSQLIEGDTDFMIGHSNFDVQSENLVRGT